MYTFKDFYRNRVQLSFRDHPFSREPKHVWVICIYHGKWLLTQHKDRGLEFPGGKVEKGETAKAAAIREVKEETGGLLRTLTYIGQYHVQGKSESIIKNIYLAQVSSLEQQETYYETNGPVLINEIPLDVKQNKYFSFIMKDDVLKRCMERINK